MAWEITILAIVIHIVAAWLILKIESVPRLFSFVAIGILVFLTISFAMSISGERVDFTTPGGWVEAGGLYTNWMSTTFNNAKTMTMNAIKLDFFNKKNESLGEENKEEKIWEKLK